MVQRQVTWALGAWVFLALLLAGCVGGQYRLADRAAQNGFQTHVFPSKTFDLTWLSRGSGPVLRAYIEGDGKAWLTRRRPSSDPTPSNPTAFTLATQDTGPAVAWLARPCQFTGENGRRNCVTPFWTSARFAEPVVRDLSAALDRAKQAVGADRLELVGYSGGGAVALLIAARRTDVSRVITVAGNVDHAFWTRLHHVSPLRDSLNPADNTDRLHKIPQVHIVSTDDDVMPPAVARHYLARFADKRRVRIVTVHGIEHDGDWGPALTRVLKETP